MAVVASGFGVTLLVAEDGSVFSFGLNDSNQLGSARMVEHRYHPYCLKNDELFDGLGVFLVAVGNKHAACVTKDGSLWTWGWGGVKVNFNRRMGHGPDVCTDTSKGESINEITLESGKQIQSFRNPGRLGKEHFENSPVVNVACGDHTVLVLTAAGHVWSCSCEEYDKVKQATSENKFVKIDPVHFDNKAITKIACGDDHQIALNSMGKVYTWGSNCTAQGCRKHLETIYIPMPILTGGIGSAVVTQIYGGKRVTIVVTADGNLFQSNRWGEDDAMLFGELQRLRSRDNFERHGIRSISSANGFTLAVTNDGYLYTWGYDNNDCIGLTSPYYVTDPIIFPQPSDGSFINENIAAVSVSRSHKVIVKTDGTVYTWGQSHSTIVLTYPDYAPLGLGYKAESKTVGWPRLLNPHYLTDLRIGTWHDYVPEHE